MTAPMTFPAMNITQFNGMSSAISSRNMWRKIMMNVSKYPVAMIPEFIFKLPEVWRASEM